MHEELVMMTQLPSLVFGRSCSKIWLLLPNNPPPAINRGYKGVCSFGGLQKQQKKIKNNQKLYPLNQSGATRSHQISSSTLLEHNLGRFIGDSTNDVSGSQQTCFWLIYSTLKSKGEKEGAVA